jgi:hypothetical protein
MRSPCCLCASPNVASLCHAKYLICSERKIGSSSRNVLFEFNIELFTKREAQFPGKKGNSKHIMLNR